MKKLKKLFLILVLVIFLLVLTGCGDEKSKTSKTDTNTTSTTNTDTKNSEKSGDNMSDSKKFTEELKNVESSKIVENAQAQMAQPEKGDNIAVLNVEGYGQIKIKFFEDVAPKACENFITHAKEGYYNGLTFHRVMNEFMIQGGDPAGNGTGGESIWGDGFAEELSTKILPYRGALCMASAGVGTNSLGSQFFIVQANYRQDMEAYLSQYGYDNLLEAYKQFSGDLFDLVIYGQYTTFGQVIEGMDIVDKIASVETDPSNDKPVEDVIITSVEIVSY